MFGQFRLPLWRAENSVRCESIGKVTGDLSLTQVREHNRSSGFIRWTLQDSFRRALQFLRDVEHLPLGVPGIDHSGLNGTEIH